MELGVATWDPLCDTLRVADCVGVRETLAVDEELDVAAWLLLWVKLGDLVGDGVDEGLAVMDALGVVACVPLRDALAVHV